jgi:thymidylate synthase (FAD)
MNILTSQASIVPQGPGIIGAFKQIEKVGRACWASENLITDNSCEEFVRGLMKREHNAPLEHGTLYLIYLIGSPMYDPYYMVHFDDVRKFKQNPYSKVVEKRFDVAAQAEDSEWMHSFVEQYGPTTAYFITTNLRVIVENFTEEEVDKVLDHSVNNPYPEHKLRVTVHFTCQRAISAEFNRHRKDSMMERSSRYCNFSKDKFGNEIGIVQPDWVPVEDIEERTFEEYCKDISIHDDYRREDDIRIVQFPWSKFDYWVFANLACEYSYMNLLRLGCKPEEARDILPMDLQTELYHTAFIDDWEHFFKLRAWNSKGNRPHPEAKKLARQVFDEFVNLGLVSEQLRIDNEIVDKAPVAKS